MSTSTALSGSLAGRSVSRIGFGAMQLAGSSVDHDDAVNVLRRAVELGVNHLDTADFYGDGVTNRLIRDAFDPYPGDLVLVSKLGALHQPDGSLVPAQRPEELRAGVEDNLRHLGVEQVHVINLRRADLQPGIIATGDQRVDLDDQLAELITLRDEGKIGAIGLSNVSVDQLTAALPVGIACVQNYFSLLRRTDQPVLDLCSEHGIAYVPYFPLGSAHSALPRVSVHPDVIKIAEAIGATPAQVGLAWLLRHDQQILLIPGTGKIDHLEQNVAAAEIDLDPEAMMILDRTEASAAEIAAEETLFAARGRSTGQ
ncbi:aldo/keto reductase [Microlunatus elymi]|uniref:Aldo/keto reductase n=1 Tax=Microlunatus elymi TaxID=2596828 RepID=A0A516Q393_9ACTN|nr:aldo/keto reductase [Microlunatus elymi]QDP97896.1 aldo/keto reductase [Microlunatus elymi]